MNAARKFDQVSTLPPLLQRAVDQVAGEWGSTAREQIERWKREPAWETCASTYVERVFFFAMEDPLWLERTPAGAH